jgi:hypothetical protein
MDRKQASNWDFQKFMRKEFYKEWACHGGVYLKWMGGKIGKAMSLRQA